MVVHGGGSMAASAIVGIGEGEGEGANGEVGSIQTTKATLSTMSHWIGEAGRQLAWCARHARTSGTPPRPPGAMEKTTGTGQQSAGLANVLPGKFLSPSVFFYFVFCFLFLLSVLI